MSETSAFAYPPPPDLVESHAADVMSRLPLSKQAEIHWRLLAATMNGDEGQVSALLRAIQAVADPQSVPRCDPVTVSTVPVEGFLAQFAR